MTKEDSSGTSATLNQALKAAPKMVVTFHYTLKNKSGAVLDSSDGGEPLSYLHGRGHIVQGLERAIEGKRVGETLNVCVVAAEGYGERNDELVLSLPRSQGKLPDGVGVGDMLELRSPDGQRIPAKILEITDEFIKVDANHQLAGEDLYFDVTLHAIRPATKQEEEHGHVHGEGGVDH